MKCLGQPREVKIKTVIARPGEAIICDKCGIKILPYPYKDRRNQYVRIHTWHNDWSNDSVESHEYNEYCVTCAKEVVAEYIGNMQGTEELELENDYLAPSDTVRE
jgi:hypothetical protein